MRCTYLFTLCLIVLASAVQAQEAPVLSPESLVDAVSHRDEAVRRMAANELRRRGVESVPTLVKAVAEGDKRSAIAAAYLLTGITVDTGNEGEQWANLNTVIKDGSADEWRWSIAASLLARTKADILQDDVVPSLMDALDSSSALKQYAAAKLMYYRGRGGLGEHADQAAEALGRLLGAYRPFVELDISDSVISTGLLGYIEHIELAEDPSQPLAEAATFFDTPDHFLVATLERIADPQNATLKALVKRGYHYVAANRGATAQLTSASRLGALGEPEAGLAIARRVVRQRWQPPQVRLQALSVIGELGATGRPALGEATGLLKDRHRELRIAAAASIAKIVAGAEASELASTKAALQRALELAQLAGGEEEVTTLTTALGAVSP